MRILPLSFPLLLCSVVNGATVTVVVKPGADPVEKLAASELARYLGKLYPADRFTVAAAASGKRMSIVLGTPRSAPTLAQFKDRLGAPESFVVSSAGSTGYIAGADPRGALYGVYALLEKLGCGFYIGYDTLPAPRKEPFGLAEWKLADAPLYADRIVFDWHNFLTSASTWELEDWQHYISQAAKMRFNAIMVHAYGNNPMYQFRYNGLVKPVGYLTTTRSGRDWGTQHVNDVRRVTGGEAFVEPVFGASVAKVPEGQGAEAATALMKKVFAYARSRSLGVAFALDVDTESANPQEIIATLPASARFRAGRFELANPDTPEGYAYFKAQIEQLLVAYPEIDRLVIWFRPSGTCWTQITLGELPAAWRPEYDAVIAKYPELRSGQRSPGFFAVGKLVRAAQRALRDLKRTDVELATGTWGLHFTASWDAFMPRGIAYLPLDSNISLGGAGQGDLEATIPGQKVIPIVWAQHDDRTFNGRPYTPFAGFPSLLKHSGVSGFGIIHWTWRPLDFYFKSLAQQVWKATAGQSLEETARRMAADNFGPAGEGAGADYLFRFATEAPMFGRETTNRFMDIPLPEPAANMSRMEARLASLGRIDRNALTPEQGERLEYWRGYERFMLGFFESQTAWERAVDFYKKGDADGARREIAQSHPAAVIQAYADAARKVRISPGERGLIVSLNLRWLPYIVSLRQALRLEPVRIKYGPTQHEPLAQSPGLNTFYFDGGKNLWKTLGEKETGAQAVAWQASEVRDELGQTAVRVDKPIALALGPIMGDTLVSGRCTLELIFVNPPSGGESAVEVAAGEGRETFDIAAGAGRGELARFRMEFVAGDKAPEARIRPVRGTAYLAGAVVTPLPAH